MMAWFKRERRKELSNYVKFYIHSKVQFYFIFIFIHHAHYKQIWFQQSSSKSVFCIFSLLIFFGEMTSKVISNNGK